MHQRGWFNINMKYRRGESGLRERVEPPMQLKSRVPVKGAEWIPRRHPLEGLLLKKVFIAAVFSVMTGAFALGTPLAARLMFDGLQTYPPLAPSGLANAMASDPMAVVML